MSCCGVFRVQYLEDKAGFCYIDMNSRQVVWIGLLMVNDFCSILCKTNSLVAGLIIRMDTEDCL